MKTVKSKLKVTKIGTEVTRTALASGVTNLLEFKKRREAARDDECQDKDKANLEAYRSALSEIMNILLKLPVEAVEEIRP